MGKIFSILAAISHRLFGSKRLLPLEEMCFKSWRDSLSSEAKAILDKQLDDVYLVQRQAAGAKVCFFYRRGAVPPLFDQNAPDLHVATVVLQAAKDRQMAVKVYVHRGRFFSLEFPKRPERYLEQHHMSGAPLQVAEVKKHVIL